MNIQKVIYKLINISFNRCWIYNMWSDVRPDRTVIRGYTIANGVESFSFDGDSLGDIALSSRTIRGIHRYLPGVSTDDIYLTFKLWIYNNKDKISTMEIEYNKKKVNIYF